LRQPVRRHPARGGQVFTLDVSAWFFERPSDVVSLPRSWTLTRLKRRTGSALDAGAVRLVQPQGGGSGAVSVRGLALKCWRTLCASKCRCLGSWRRQRNALFQYCASKRRCYWRRNRALAGWRIGAGFYMWPLCAFTGRRGTLVVAKIRAPVPWNEAIVRFGANDRFRRVVYVSASACSAYSGNDAFHSATVSNGSDSEL